MPLDLGLLRSNSQGGNIEQVKRWQSLRAQQNQETSSLIEKLKTRDTDRRECLHHLQEHRYQIKQCQRLLSPKEKGNISAERQAEVRDEIRHLQQNIIPQVQEQLQELVCQMDALLPKIGTMVDETLLDTNEFAATPLPLEPSGAPEVLVDVLRCLDGSTVLDPQVTLFQGVGATLARSLVDATIRLFPSYPLLILSNCEVEISSAHALLGCCSSQVHGDCPICHAESSGDNSMIPSPSVVTLARLHQRKTYWDRQLPLGYVARTLAEPSSTSSMDARENVRRASFRHSHKKRQPRPHSERVELFVLTGGTLSESRLLQLEIIERLRAFYTSLLVVQSTHENADRFVRVRTISPPQLLPAEASRIVLEGCLSGGHVVQLAYVSNLVDSASRFYKIKCGNDGGQSAIANERISCPFDFLPLPR